MISYDEWRIQLGGSRESSLYCVSECPRTDRNTVHVCVCVCVQWLIAQWQPQICHTGFALFKTILILYPPPHPSPPAPTLLSLPDFHLHWYEGWRLEFTRWAAAWNSLQIFNVALTKQNSLRSINSVQATTRWWRVASPITASRLCPARCLQSTTASWPQTRGETEKSPSMNLPTLQFDMLLGFYHHRGRLRVLKVFKGIVRQKCFLIKKYKIMSYWDFTLCLDFLFFFLSFLLHLCREIFISDN